MMSLSSHCDAKSMSDEPAEPRRVGPGPVTPAPGGFLGRPDLLERRPVIRRAFRPHEPRGVGPLKDEVHLQAAVVRAAAVRPAALVVMDAEERLLVRRMLRPAPGRRCPLLPQPNRALDIGHAHLRQHSALGLHERDAHQPLPAPGGLLVAGDLASEPDDCRMTLLLCFCADCCSCLGCAAADAATAACEQANANQDGSPQFPTSTW